MSDKREQAIKDVAAATNWSTDDVRLFLSNAGTKNDDGDDRIYVYAVTQREAVLELADKVIARGCCCHSTADEDWHAESCVIPSARAALERSKP